MQSIGAASLTSSKSSARVSPAFMRSLMPGWPDPLDELFRKHRLALYRLMELNARQQKLSVEYSVTDDVVTDERLLQCVYERLTNWLMEKRFHVTVGSRSARSFVVSWDPVHTPNSLTEEEKNNRESVAARRLRSYQQSASRDDPDLLSVLGFGTPHSRLQEQHAAAPSSTRDSNCSDAYQHQLAAPPQAPDARSRSMFHSLLDERSDISEVRKQAQTMARRAANVAGANRDNGRHKRSPKKHELQMQQQERKETAASHSSDDGTTVTASSDE